MIIITPALSIDPADISEHFVRAPGPGGQNVNKVSSAVQLRFDTLRCKTLSDAQRVRLRHLAGNRINSDGVLIVTAHSHRQQSKNRREAMDKLVRILERCTRQPKVRKPTRPSPAERRRRLEAKRRKGSVKRDRRKGGPGWD